MLRLNSGAVARGIPCRLSTLLGAVIGFSILSACGPSAGPIEGSNPPEGNASTGNWRRLPGASDYWGRAIRAYSGGIPLGAWASAHRDLEPLRAASSAKSNTLGFAAALGVGGSTWTPMGPAPLTGGQSWPSSGTSNASGRASVVAVNSAAPSSGEFWLGTANGGVWHRGVGQTKWEPLTDSASSLAVGAIAVDKCKATGGCDAIYVGTGENAFRRDTYYGNGVLLLHPPIVPHAQLAGEAAEQVLIDEHFGEPGPDSMFRFGAAQNLLLDPQSPQDGRTLYLTVSRGETTNATDSSVLSPTPTSGFGVFRLDLGTAGATWTKKTPLTSQVPATVGAVDLEMDPVNTHTLYAAFEGNGIWKTTDRGETWTNFNAGIAPNLVSGVLASPRPEIALIREAGAAGPTLYVILGIKSAKVTSDAGLASCLHPFASKRVPSAGAYRASTGLLTRARLRNGKR